MCSPTYVSTPLAFTKQLYTVIPKWWYYKPSIRPEYRFKFLLISGTLKKFSYSPQHSTLFILETNSFEHMPIENLYIMTRTQGSKIYFFLIYTVFPKMKLYILQTCFYHQVRRMKTDFFCIIFNLVWHIFENIFNIRWSKPSFLRLHVSK